MCHHYRAAANLPAEFVAEFSLRTNQRRAIEDLVADMKDAGAWPLRSVPALRIDESGELVAFAAEWGLLPRWWKPSDKTPKRAKFQRQTFNARSETAHQKPTFREAWKRRRCLLPMVEFFEKDHWFRVAADCDPASRRDSRASSGDAAGSAPRGGRGAGSEATGTPSGDAAIRVATGHSEPLPIAFAGLWETWQSDDAEVVTATLLTCEPNAEVRGVGHHRMPVLLTTPDDRRRWLVEGAEGPNDPLLRPLQDDVLSVTLG